MSQLILQPFHCFTYVTVHSTTLLSLLLRYKLCSFFDLSVTSPTSQLILQPFRRFTYVTVHSPTLPLLHLRHSSFSNPSFASTTSQALHVRHLASRPCHKSLNYYHFIPGRSGRFKRLLWTCCTCSTKAVRFRTRVPFKRLSTQCPLHVLEVCTRNFRTLCILNITQDPVYE